MLGEAECSQIRLYLHLLSALFVLETVLLNWSFCLVNVISMTLEKAQNLFVLYSVNGL